jgi:hypothetical protein
MAERAERAERALKRRHLIYYLRVFDCATGELLGHLVDITVQGLMLMSEKRLETGKDYRLKMQIDPVATTPAYLEFNARSIWCREDMNPSFYDTGFELLDASLDEFNRISQLIDELGFAE